MKKSNRLTIYILIAMVAGIVLGYIVHQNLLRDFIKSFSTNIKLLTTIFLRLVQMIIAPLGIFYAGCGHCQTGRSENRGRVGGKAMLWFVTASLAVCYWVCCW